MNDRMIVFLYFLLSVISCLFGIQMGLDAVNIIAVVIVAVGLFLICIPIYQMGKTTPFLYYVTIALNSFATGIVISLYYQYYEQSPSFETTIYVSLYVMLAFFIFYMISLPKSLGQLDLLVGILFVLGCYILTIVLWVQHNEIIYSLLFFLMHLTYFYVIGLLRRDNGEEALRSSALITFGLFAVVTIIVLVIISEGDILEGGTAIIYPGNGKKQENE